MNFFIFYDKINPPSIGQNEKGLYIPKNISRESEICDTYELGLNFPSYFGKNWDALLDCLRDLSFIDEKNILIIHEDIPFIENQKSKRIYLEILFDTVRHWWDFPQHKFYPYFPESCKNEVTHIIETRTYD